MALAPGDGRVPVIYEYRDLKLESGVVVPDVLVGVHEESGDVLTVPAQSTPKIKESRSAPKEAVLEARVPREFQDILGLLAEHFDANEKKLTPALIRFYLRSAVEDPRLGRRLARLSEARLAQGVRRARLRVRCESELAEKVEAVANELPGSNQSDLVRGAVLAAKEDVLDQRAARRAEKLGAVAAAV